MESINETAKQTEIDYDHSLKIIKAQVSAQKKLLEKLISTSTPIDIEASSDSTTYYRQIRCLTEAFKSLYGAQSFLPTFDSHLPDLLAKRVTSQTISETQLAITQCELSLQSVKKSIETEKADLKDTKLIQDELVTRITSLQKEVKLHLHKSSNTLAQEKIKEFEDEKSYYENETSNLMAVLTNFIDENLAPMLAVEELGGPVVGQLLTVDDSVFENGITNYGKVKKTKNPGKKRQSRINQIWGSSPEEENWDEKSAAASEIRELIEQLLNSMAHADGYHPNTYVNLRRESAAARLLVRSKVAQYHPKDASKLRLIEFGTEIGD
ncbi:hypothetical protein OnM2_004017 [Erysiphe neolycopersici]|uniref:Uncharacterized protein n=1 Tax=Erysiphe neolycopersici TaxID=212602 RepID=A0A420I7R4_9PEZI|nr:hypothetical protein OnM2_004017 [Erysiphe neolycopersici]